MVRLYQELHCSHPEDLKPIKRYARWLRLRRQVNNYFYLVPQMHWVKPPRLAHWI